ncbi:GNAT family N-acetyltransferase [Actinospica sp. MGRD01-02]|uniref:GNAT family N-acetyltransferase n=1 Tax=Actinospica acidithermotolerans TaxID=2828514 RepID=A0A941EF19_9ACTN|nr:GNAT family N-acetyltransferase [Actinospica acidithermotolerans]MBR7827874.1 GNAT family N-acetyltransferase [Actinospica acidithermotolerans]
MQTPGLVEITPENVTAACRIEVRPEQQAVVSPVAWSLAVAYANQAIAWPRLIVDGDEVVGFVMAGFDTSMPPESFFRCGVWRLNIAAEHQGRGYGRFAVEAVCEQARRRGERRVTVLWVPHEHGPERFYLGLGFRPTGEVFHGEVVGELLL